MKPIIGDCFIGDFPVTQVFGVNPLAYAKFGLKGHNGIDFGCPNNTQIISSTDGLVIKVASDSNGYGNFAEVWDDKQLCATLYAHFDHAVISVGDRVVRGQLLGLSDNTGNSTGPHLHFGFCLTDEKGLRLNQTNGFFGWLDPNKSATWQITNPTEPVKSETTVAVPASKFEELVSKATERDRFVAGGYATIDDVIKKVGDLQNELSQKQNAINTLNSKIADLSEAIKKDAIEDYDVGVKLVGLERDYQTLKEAILGLGESLGCPTTGVSDLDLVVCIRQKHEELKKPEKETIKYVEKLQDTLEEVGVYKRVPKEIQGWITRFLNWILRK